MNSPRSKVKSPNSHRNRKARLQARGWIYLPPESNGPPLPKFERSSAIDPSHIIGKRLRSNVERKQNPSKMKKKTSADQINGKSKRTFDNGLMQPNQSAGLFRKSYNTVDTMKEREEISAQESVPADDGISSSSSLTELDDLSETTQEEVDMIDMQYRHDKENCDAASSPDPRKEDEKETGSKMNHAGHLSEIRLRKRVQLLEQQVTGLVVRKAEGEAQYENTIKKLLEQNYNQNLRLNILRTHNKGKEPESTANDLLTAELYAQDQEIRRLKSNLNEALRLNELLSSQSSKIYAIELTKSTRQVMHQIESSIIFAADLLCQALLSQPLKQSPHEQMDDFIVDSIGNLDLLHSHSSAAFRAIIFKFVRDRIFYFTDMWATLHFESLMLRVYQSTLQRAVTPEFLEKFHRAALHLMLQDSGHFKDLFVIPHAEILTIDIMALLGQFLDNDLLQRSHHEERIKKCLKDLFCDAIGLRASYFAAPGTRYELIQYKPGTIYNPQFMQVQPIPIENMKVPPDDSKPLRIKVCVHGSIISHAVQETSSIGLDRLKDWSQPFIEGGENSENDVPLWKGKLASQKASVILE